MLQRGFTLDCSANTRATCNANPLLQWGGLAAGPTARLSRPLLASGSRTRRAPCPWALPASSRGAQRPTSKPQSGSSSKAASKRAPHGGAAPQEPAAQPGSTTTPSTPTTPTSSSAPSAAGSSPVEGLNEEQLAACLADAPVARVKAGPGSGKTRVVVARVQHLVAERGVPPHRILAITFTNKAANELKERLAAAGCGAAEAAAAGSGAGGGGGPVAKTFHGLGAWMLRQSVPAAPQLGVTPGFKVLDADQSDKLMRRAVREVEQLQQQAAGGGGGGGGGGSGAVSGAGDSSASSNSSNSRNGSSSSGDGSSSSSSRPLPVALPALPADELTSRAVAILGERLSDLIPDLKMRLAAAAPTVPEGRELDAATRLPAAEPGQGRAQAALPPAAPEASQVARGVDDKAAGDKRAVAARWHRKQVQAYICMYQRLLCEHNAFDFSDLIAQPGRLLAARPDLAAGWRRRFDHILVDEFQDTDPAQYELIKLLLRPPSAPLDPGTHLFVVGDPDQAIYGWRGAEVGHMRDLLPRDFPHTATFLMSTNYRSDPHIVAAADKVLWAGQPTTSPRSSSSPLSSSSSSSSSSAQARELYKAPVPARPPSAAGAGAVLRRLVFPDPQAEARWVAGRVVGWANSGELGPRSARRLGEVAVLYRNRDMSRPLEEALTLRGVPYTVVGGQPFWSYADVADAVAYLHILMDPLRCDVFLERVINEPKRGLGDTSLDKLRAAARERRSTLSRLIFEDCLQGADGGSSSGGDSSSSSGGSSTATGRRKKPSSAGINICAGSSSPSSSGTASSSSSSGSIGGVAAESAAAAPLALAGGLVRKDWVLSPELATVEGAAGIAASFAPEVGEGSPLHAIKLTKAAKQGLQSLRGLLVCLRRMAARGAAVSELLAAALALSGYRAALLQAEAEGAGRRAASSKKKTVAEEASERLERLAQLQELAASPGVWVTHDDPLEPQPGGEEAAAAGEVELAGEPGEDAQRPSASSSASEAPAPQEPGPTAATAGAAVVSRGLAGVGRFLEHAALVTGADMADSGGGRGGRGGRGSGSGAVRLMTLHASKGLEFQRVFIVGVEDGLLPSARSAADPHRLGEERRLFYVGVTRAKDQLFLCRCKQRLVYGRPEALQPSPFLRHLQLKEEVLQ